MDYKHSVIKSIACDRKYEWRFRLSATEIENMDDFQKRKVGVCISILARTFGGVRHNAYVGAEIPMLAHSDKQLVDAVESLMALEEEKSND